MSEKDTVVLVVTTVNLSEMSLEVRHDRIILVRAVAVRSDAAKKMSFGASISDAYTHYLFTRVPAASFALKRSLLSRDAHIRNDLTAIRAGNILRKRTR